MISSLSSVVPLDSHAVAWREPGERLDEEVYRSIPALSDLAKSAVDVGNRLSVAAREALFYDRSGDFELRSLHIETALTAQHEMATVKPDLEWMRGAEPVSRKTFQGPENDVWLEPSPPSP